MQFNSWNITNALKVTSYSTIFKSIGPNIGRGVGAFMVAKGVIEDLFYLGRNLMDKYIKIGIVVGVLVSINYLVHYSLNNKNKKDIIKKTNVIRQPILYLYAGIAGITLFTLLSLYFLFIQKELPSFIIMIVLDIPYIFIMLFQFFWKIEVNNDSFNYRNMFGKIKEFKFEDIQVKEIGKGTRIYINGKHIVGISYLQDNWNCLKDAFELYNESKK